MLNALVKNVEDREDETAKNELERHGIELALLTLVTKAQEAGFNVEIFHVSEQPLAMRNTRPIIYVWKAR